MFIEWIYTNIDQPITILILFLNSFLSATILPLGSEFLYLALIKLSNHGHIILFFVATIGNSLGGITNLYLGHFLKNKWKNRARYLTKPEHNKNLDTQNQHNDSTTKILKPTKKSRTNRKLRIYAHRLIKRYGYWALLLSWLPMIGDVICLIAGWKNLNRVKSSAMIAIGKAMRYLFLLIPFYL